MPWRPLFLSEDNPVPPHLLVSVRVPSRGGLEGVSLQAGQPQTGAKPGQVNAPAVGERFAVQVLSLSLSSERNILGETFSLIYGGGSRAGLAGLQVERERAGAVRFVIIIIIIIMRRLECSDILTDTGSTGWLDPTWSS